MCNKAIIVNPDFICISVHAVVHCSDGIGRTGTVLFCLLCHDHLLYNKKVDIFAVLHQLRSNRARLVENLAQFKLCLKLLDEILFGCRNTILAPDLEQKLPELVADCGSLIHRMNQLPNALDTVDSGLPENAPYNRNQNILTSLSNRVFLQVHFTLVDSFVDFLPYTESIS